LQAAGAIRINLPAVPAGDYVALRLLLAENGVSATGREGRAETVTPSMRDVHVPLAAAIQLSAAGDHARRQRPPGLAAEPAGARPQD
jgi:hypothetical protein